VHSPLAEECHKHHFRHQTMEPRVLLACRKLELLVSVRKIVPTLTSTSTEIYLSMAGAKKLGDTRFILVPSEAVRPAGVCSRHCIALHRGACRGVLQARRVMRRSLQVPEVRLRQSTNIVSVGGNVLVSLYSSPRLGDRPLLL
jgi:hypothetical protein